MDNQKNNLENVNKIILVLSGKGGVGKSTVSTNIAYSLYMSGNKVGLLDADIHGPNIPLMLGIEGMRLSDLKTPYVISDNLKVASVSFFLENTHNPVILRGPAKTSTIIQLIENVEWGDLDYMVVDLPPGTGDEPLSIMQLLPEMDGVVIVTIPSEVSQIVVKKAVTFSRQLGIPIIGLLENMSGFVCPHCGRTDFKHQVTYYEHIWACGFQQECPYCGRTSFDSKSGYERHVWACGLGGKCQYCGRTEFGSRTGYLEHIRACRTKLICPSCQKDDFEKAVGSPLDERLLSFHSCSVPSHL